MKSKELGRLRRIAEQLVKLQQELNEASESDRVNYRKRPPNVRSSHVGHAQWERFTNLENAANDIGRAVMRLGDATEPLPEEPPEKLCARCRRGKLCAKCRASILRHVTGEA